MGQGVSEEEGQGLEGWKSGGGGETVSEEEGQRLEGGTWRGDCE